MYNGIGPGCNWIYLYILVYAFIYLVYKLSNTAFTLNQALSALRRRLFSAALQCTLLAYFARLDLPLECLLNTQTTQAGLATSKISQP